MGRHERCCPTCGNPISRQVVEVDLASGMVRCGTWQMYGLARRQSLLLEAIAAAFPRGITKSAAVEATYGRHEDHLKDSDQAVEFTANGLRRSLAKSGAPFEIKSKRFGGYWIELNVDRPIA